MPDAEALTVFLAAAIALNLTPGPDMLYVAARSAGEGRSAGIVSALGIAAGCLTWLGVRARVHPVPLGRRERGARWLQRLTGAMFVGLGLRLALGGRR